MVHLYSLSHLFYLQVGELFSMNYNRLDLKYPIFGFIPNDNMVYVINNSINLRSSSKYLLKKLNYFKGVVITDTSGCRYIIKKAYMVRYRGLFGFNPLLKGRQILIDFEYEPVVETISLDTFKKEIICRIDKTKHIWQSGWDINDLKNMVLNSNSFKEIANYLS